MSVIHATLATITTTKGLIISTYLSLASVCGATSAMVDVYDIDLNPHGVICCANCESIVLCRKAWDFMYSVPLYVNLSKVLELK